MRWVISMEFGWAYGFGTDWRYHILYGCIQLLRWEERVTRLKVYCFVAHTNAWQGLSCNDKSNQLHLITDQDRSVLFPEDYSNAPEH